MPKKTKNIKYYEAVGRRKSAVARVRLYVVNKEKVATVGQTKVKQGEILVNKKPIEKVFPLLSDKVVYLKPLKLVNCEDRFVVSIIVKGGGKNGQIEAILLSLTRALERVDETYRPILKRAGLLTVDARVRERRKVGTGGKARRAKQSPKR